MARATFNISLPAEMALEVEAAMKREHRTRSELFREALRLYFAMTQHSPYTPTPAERRAIARGRAELRRGEAATLADLDALLERPDRASSAKGRPTRSTRGRRTASKRAR